MHITHSECAPPYSPIRGHPPPSLPVQFPDLWIWVLFCDQFSFNHWIGIIHWHLVGSPVSTQLKAMTLPFSLNLQSANSSTVGHKAPCAPPPPTLHCWQAHCMQLSPDICIHWVCGYNGCVFSIKWNFATILPIFWIFYSSIPLPQCSLSLRGERVHTLFKGEYSIAIYFQHLMQMWVSAVTTIDWGEDTSLIEAKSGSCLWV